MLTGFSGGGSTSGAHFYDVRIVGPQSGETNYHECIIEALSNSHCHYDSCGFLTPSSQAYTIQHSSTIGTGHITDLHNCYGDEGAAIIDRNGSRLNQRYVAFCGNITFKNQNRATDSGTIWLNMNGGTVTIDSSCTTGVINISGVCNVVNNSGGTTVDVTQVTAAWSNPAASFNAAGSMGAQLNAAGAGGDPWAQTIEGSFTAAEVLRIVAAALAGQRSGIGTATETYRGLDGSTNRIVLTPDSNGNGTPVLDGS